MKIICGFRSTSPGLFKPNGTNISDEQLIQSPIKSQVTSTTCESETFTFSNSSSSEMMSEEMTSKNREQPTKKLITKSQQYNPYKKHDSAFSYVKPKIIQYIEKQADSRNSNQTSFSLELSKSSSNTSSSSILSSGSCTFKNLSKSNLIICY